MRLETYLDVSHSPSEEDLLNRLVSSAETLGFGLVSAALIWGDFASKSFAGKSVTNTPNGFEEACRDISDARRDPLLGRLMRSSLPLTYDGGLYQGAGAGDLYDAQAAFGYKHGVAVALHLPNDRHFLLGVDRPDPLPKSSAAVARIMADVHLLAAHANEAAQTLFTTASLARKEFKLTSRELEVMRWTLEGKTAWETGMILGISEHTVDFHAKSATRKIGVPSRTQAAIHCMKLGLI